LRYTMRSSGCNMDKFTKNIKNFNMKQKSLKKYDSQNTRLTYEEIIRYLKDNPIENRNYLGQLFNALGLIKYGAEIGVQEGKFSQILSNTWNGEQLHLIDSWKHFQDDKYIDISNVNNFEHEKLYQKVVAQFSNNPKIKINRTESLKAAGEYPNNYFDWIFLDANHSYESCSADLKAWYPKIKRNGIFSGHDFINKHDRFGLFGVERAVREHVEYHRLYLFITKYDSSWYFVKQ